MKNKKFSEWILPTASTVIALMLIAVFTAISSFLGKFESTMIKLHSEQAIQVLKLQTRQTEFQKGKQKNYNKIEENKKLSDKKYSEMNNKIDDINVSIAKIGNTQSNTLIEIENIHKLFDRILGYTRIVNSK